MMSRSINCLGKLQRAIVEVMDVVWVSDSKEIAEAMSIDISKIKAKLTVLCHKGYVERLTEGKTHQPAKWKRTAKPLPPESIDA